MAERPFEYDYELLRACARSRLASYVTAKYGRLITNKENGGDETSTNDDRWSISNLDAVASAQHTSCLQLFQQHAEHYGRPAVTNDEIFRTTVTEQGADQQVEIAKRLVNFLQSVTMVHYNNKQSERLMKLALNRFSDMDHEDDDDDVDETLLLDRRLRGAPTVEGWEGLVELAEGIEIGILTELTSAESILHVTANLGIGKGSMNALHPKGSHHGYKSHSKADYQAQQKLHIQANGAPEIFKTPEVSDPSMDGSVLAIKKKKHHAKQKAALGGEGGAQPVQQSQDDDGFATRIDWSTNDNPDGVSIVHRPIDQGMCGSCWALAATGSLEASAARREANTAFLDALAESVTDYSNETLSEKAMEYAREVEKESFHELDLSVQELVDCDQSADQGCTGGNPLLAFYFIHRYGLTSTANYPYVGSEDKKCRKDLVKAPIATVKSWGIISPNHEDHMALVLRYIGPIAVGVNGADPAFRSYSGGIFDHGHCKQGANHALLITGYDQDIQEDGSIVRYWIARNSWGSGWGINGYAKMIRGDGRKGTPGICGMARSPSVALGGRLLYGDRAKRFAIPGYAEDDGPLSNFCFRFGMGMNLKCIATTTWIDGHRAYALGSISVLFTFAAVWVLSRGARRRRRRRRRVREQKREQERLAALAAAVDGNGDDNEATSLLATNENGISYGAN